MTHASMDPHVQEMFPLRPVENAPKGHALEVARIFHDTVLDVVHHAPGKAVAGLPANGPRFVWVTGAWVCDFPANAVGTLQTPGGVRELSLLVADGSAEAVGEGRYQVGVEPGARLLARVGDVTVMARAVQPGRKVAGRFSDEVDYPFLGVFTFAGFLGMLMAIIVAMTPPPPSVTVLDVPDRFAEVFLQKVDPPPAAKAEQPKPIKEEEGARAKKEEGMVGATRSKVLKAGGPRRNIARIQADREAASEAGLLGALTDSSLAGVLDNASLDVQLMGGISGLLATKGMGSGPGLGTRGNGLGGGGHLGGLGPGLGIEGGGPGAHNVDGTVGSMGSKEDGARVSLEEDPIMLGQLDRALVDAVIKRHLNQIRYCYQRELTKNPALAGKVTTGFVIAGDGSVSKAWTKRSTVGSNEVETCIERRIMQMTFPAPKKGGIVQVSYPFLFSPG